LLATPYYWLLLTTDFCLLPASPYYWLILNPGFCLLPTSPYYWLILNAGFCLLPASPYYWLILNAGFSLFPASPCYWLFIIAAYYFSQAPFFSLFTYFYWTLFIFRRFFKDAFGIETTSEISSMFTSLFFSEI
jgi:hypothetical protein